MIISNIISKLLTIIYNWLEMIYKIITAPTNKNQQSRLNYYKYKFHRTHLHDLLTHLAHDKTSMCLSLAHISTITTYFLLSLHTFLLKHRDPLFCRSLLLSKVFLQVVMWSWGPHLAMFTWCAMFRILVRTMCVTLQLGERNFLWLTMLACKGARVIL